jgi:hypothetical protein
VVGAAPRGERAADPGSEDPGAGRPLSGYAGLGLFVYLIVKTGPKEILKALGRLSIWEIGALMGLRFLYWLIRAVNWRALLVACDERVPFRRILEARIAGYAVSYLTPAGNIGGETVRIFVLDCVGRNKAWLPSSTRRSSSWPAWPRSPWRSSSSSPSSPCRSGRRSSCSRPSPASCSS